MTDGDVSLSWPWWRQWRPTAALRASAAWHVAAAAGCAAWPAAWPAFAGGVALNHAALAGIGCWPLSTALGPSLTRVDAAVDQVFLTFDDGPDPEVTPEILDRLDAAGASATFFCIGRRAAACPALVREIVDRGHDVQNHTMNHPNSFACLGIGGLQREIGLAQRALAQAGAPPPRFFRPPMGIRSPLLDMALAGSGLSAVAWTRRGFDTVRRDPARLLATLVRQLAAGDILLLHDGSCARSEAGTPVSLAALPALLDVLRQRRLRAVSLSRGIAEITPPSIAKANRAA